MQLKINSMYFQVLYFNGSAKAYMPLTLIFCHYFRLIKSEFLLLIKIHVDGSPLTAKCISKCIFNTNFRLIYSVQIYLKK